MNVSLNYNLTWRQKIYLWLFFFFGVNLSFGALQISRLQMLRGNIFHVFALTAAGKVVTCGWGGLGNDVEIRT